jgi:glycosyltransferase involved in cell wall biosynthesis
MAIKVSIIIAVYNKLRELRLIFAALQRQSYTDFEVLLADDGSGEAFVRGVGELVATSPFPVQHVWHEDSGFRKTAILNKAVVRAKSDYLIFIDGDCIPHPKFVEAHYKAAQKGVCLAGRRLNLSEKMSAKLTESQVQAGFLEKNLWKIFVEVLQKKANMIEKGIYLPCSPFRDWLNRKDGRILGCNFSLHKSDLLAINGFDERYELPGHGEDSDIDFRLRLIGVTIRSFSYAAVQYHLYHRLLPRHEENQLFYEQRFAEKIAVTPFGIEKLKP